MFAIINVLGRKPEHPRRTHTYYTIGEHGNQEPTRSEATVVTTTPPGRTLFFASLHLEHKTSSISSASKQSSILHLSASTLISPSNIKAR